MKVPAQLGILTALLVSTSCAGCLRAPIGDDLQDGAGGSGDGEPTDGAEGTSRADGDETGDGTGGTTVVPGGECHPSYEPCLPIVDDLNCPEVVALGAAPVNVIGPDVYGLDSDNDGIGCEN